MKLPFATWRLWFGAIFLACVGSACTHAQTVDNRPDATAQQLVVTITEGVLSLNGTEVRVPASPQEFVKLLGKPSRESALANTILTWDDFGIYLYVSRDGERSIGISFSLQQESYSFIPKKVFAGRIIVDGAEITKSSTADQINVASKGAQFQFPSGVAYPCGAQPRSWIAEYATGTIYLEIARPPRTGVVKLHLSYHR
jgi:hypothetical protein